MVIFTVSISYEGPQYGFNSLYVYPRNQQIPKAHLMPIPATEEPFSRVLIDCVGPLPKSKA